jgi:protein involved in polysaccharide export with SLBB domain
VFLTEILDTSIKTAEDIARITKLPVLATLGDLRKMSAAAQVQWAFRTLTLLKGKLSRNADQSLVCGIISANHGEGRSTWVNLLVSAASQRGLRVLTVDTRPTAAAPVTGTPSRPASPAPKPEEPASPANKESAANSDKAEKKADVINLPDHVESDQSLTPAVLTTPDKVAEQLQGPNAQPVVHIPLPGWVWNLERRKQWQKALDQWRDIDNLVIFVELPPACEPESVLLAENLPQVIWLVGSGMADAAETKTHLDTLKHAGCNVAGAVLNQAPPPFLNAKISRWFNRMTTAIVLAFALSHSVIGAQLAEPLQPALAPSIQNAVQTTRSSDQDQSSNLKFSAYAKHTRAKWQQHLTLGPGDIVDIHFFSNSVFTAQSRTNVFIGPDGRINYLYASGIQAAGLTVEELRKKISDALAPYYVGGAPTIVVVPVSFSSKKYYMLGKVNVKGAFTLDRPLTLIEAVARAKGLETGLYQRTTVELADLGHSFVVRNGEKLPIDFEKLFLEGDLSQNALIEPNDYVYFASAGANDIYVLGEVMTPGPLGFVSNATLLSALTDRGGYTERAYKRRVLVIRGSLNEPETFVVDSGGILDARLRDFKLQPRDIVYVAHRPWLKAEDMLDEAAGAFIEGAMTTWAGANVGPIITQRLLPRVKLR